MKSLYNFIIKPLNKRYDNTVKVDNKNLIVNTQVEDFKFISREAEVVSIPSAFDTVIEVGDKIIVHHNIFRRWYDQRGAPTGVWTNLDHRDTRREGVRRSGGPATMRAASA